MITVKNTINLPDTYPLERLGALTELLFFDIETTGFSGDYSNLYLIGCTYYSQGSWQLIQWFADTAEAESEVLAAFFEFLKGYRTLVHFNGDGFDIPYLLKMCIRDRSMINGITQVTSAATTTITNWRTALPKSSLVRMINPTLRSRHILFNSSLEMLR